MKRILESRFVTEIFPNEKPSPQQKIFRNPVMVIFGLLQHIVINRDHLAFLGQDEDISGN